LEITKVILAVLYLNATLFIVNVTPGITPYANLYHYDLPAALEEKYKGLLSPQVV